MHHSLFSIRQVWQRYGLAFCTTHPVARLTSWSTTLILLISMSVELGAQGYPMDPSFGVDGATFQDLLTDQDKGADVAIDSTGRMLVLATVQVNAQLSNSDFAVARLLPNGSLDATFGWYGIEMIPFDMITDGEDVAAKIAIDGQGRIVVSGTANGASSFDRGIAVARLLPNGGLDSTFGNGGKIVHRLAGLAPRGVTASDMALVNNKIVVVGSRGYGVFDEDILVLRLLDNGQLDLSFNGSGTRTFYFDEGPEYKDDMGRTVEVNASGYIYVVGTIGGGDSVSSNWQSIVAIKLDAQGQLVSKFGAAGIQRYAISESFVNKEGLGVGSLLDHEENLVIAYNSSTQEGTIRRKEIMIIRVDSEGILDRSFAGTGFRTVRFDNIGESDVADIELSSSGGITVVGRLHSDYPTWPIERRMGFARLLGNGSSDSTFGHGAPVVGSYHQKMTMGQTLLDADLYGTAIQSNGRVVAVGYVLNYPHTYGDVVIARLAP